MAADRSDAIRVTVCQLPDEPILIEHQWCELVAHVVEAQSDLVLLPEMPFSPWPCAYRVVDPSIWADAAAAHRRWLSRLSALGSCTVALTIPVVIDGRRLNQAGLWTSAAGWRPCHEKRYLPEEPGFWEATWYERGGGRFEIADCRAARVGWLVCSELWFPEHGRSQGRDGAHVLLSPRATSMSSVARWLTEGRAAAIISGCYSLSSNRCGASLFGDHWGGAGWVVDPDGRVLGVTNKDRPFLTVDVSLALAEQAKSRYPRYIL